jgi:hypothetical protein
MTYMSDGIISWSSDNVHYGLTRTPFWVIPKRFEFLNILTKIGKLQIIVEKCLQRLSLLDEIVLSSFKNCFVTAMTRH